jgi:hypothetical protein
MPGNFTPEKLKRLGADITLPREKFAELYDPLAAEADGLAAKVVRAMEGDAAPYLPELQQAVDLGFFKKFCEVLVAAKALDANEPDSPSSAEMRVELQAVVNPAYGFIPVGNLIFGEGPDAARRVCKILVDIAGAPVKGSGFLVGQDTVLTSYHVVSGLLQGDQEVPGSHSKISVEFDGVGSWLVPRTAKVAEEWYVVGSRPHPTEKPTESALDFATAAEQDFDKYLDYAVIRLAEPLGRERGFYNLEKDRYPCVEAVGSQVLVFQHPLGASMHVTVGAGKQLWPRSIRTRLRHDANTAGGASGGLVLDNAFKPVALHQCTIKVLEEVINGAIPTACIAAHGGDLGASETAPLLKLDDGKPIIGRDRWQYNIIRALHGKAAILTVAGPDGIGKTFSKRILQSHLSRADHVVAEIDATELAGDAPAVAALLLRRAGLRDDRIASLPGRGDAATALSAWIRDELFQQFAKELTAGAGRRITWFVIDNLDTSPLPDTSGRQFLERLYQDIATVPSVRVVLLGLSGAVAGAPVEQVAADPLERVTDHEIETYIKRRAIQVGVILTAQKLQALRALVAAGAPRKDIAAALETKVEPALRAGGPGG